MKLIQWTENAWSDHAYWQANDQQFVEKINLLIKECVRTPFAGTGKPEPLRGELAGFWSRRISAEHRFIYQIKGKGDEQVQSIIACRYHYDNLGKKKRN